MPSLTEKILLTILVLSLIPLIIVGYISLLNINFVNNFASTTTQEIGNLVISEGMSSLRELGEKAVKEKARDVAKQIEIFLTEHPEIDLEKIEKNETLKKIAVQPVGRTGYTAVHDIHGINRFHPDPKTVGMDFHTLQEKLPDFWRILNKSFTQETGGYYDWIESDGKIREKYMYCVPVKRFDLVVCATAYVDEFCEPVHKMKNNVIKIMNVSMYKIERIKRNTEKIIIFMFFISCVSICLAAILFIKNITFPVLKLTKLAEEIRKGNFDVKMEIKSGDEIEKLSEAFNRMVSELKEYRKRIEKHSEELENLVKKRTDELHKKIKELNESKMALLNMMEDVDEANKQLLEAQEKLRKSYEELKKMDVKKDEFISIAAHELKTPITAIHGFSQLLQNPKVAENKEMREKFLKIIDKETKRLGNLITDILDLSRIDLGSIKFNYQRVDIYEVLESIKKEASMLIKDTPLYIEYKIEKNLPKIITDRERLVQILLNLINNAVKYTPHGKITISVKKEGDFVHFSVKDTGIGIPRSQREKIFERFYQIDSSYTRQKGGTGLGLSLCKEFVERLGGRIWVESKLGKGSTFHFTLPIKGLNKSK